MTEGVLGSPPSLGQAMSIAPVPRLAADQRLQVEIGSGKVRPLAPPSQAPDTLFLRCPLPAFHHPGRHRHLSTMQPRGLQAQSRTNTPPPPWASAGRLGLL